MYMNILVRGNAASVRSLTQMVQGGEVRYTPLPPETYKPYQFKIKILDFCLDNWATIKRYYTEIIAFAQGADMEER